MGCKPSTNAQKLDEPAEVQDLGGGGGGWKNNNRNDVMYTDVETDKSMVILREEKGMSVQGVGGAANPDLKKVIAEGRNEIKQTQEKLNSSLTTPIVDHEKKVLENGSWMNEKKDVAKRFSVLPPIDDGKKVHNNGMAFTVD